MQDMGAVGLQVVWELRGLSAALVGQRSRGLIGES